MKHLKLWVPSQAGNKYSVFYAFYAFYAWWIHFPQSGALAEGTCDRDRDREESFECRDQSRSMVQWQ
jgi:hypothetical protein